MHSELQKELDQLNKKQKKTESFEDIYLRQCRINNPILPNQNLIIKVRPEIINLIFAFLDYSSFLQFRFVSQNTNNKILYLLSLKLDKIQQQQNIKQLELNEVIENHPELGDQTESLLLQYQLCLEDLKKIKRQDICELACIRIPSQIIERILTLLTILLTQNYVEQQDRWLKVLRLIMDNQFLNYLLNFYILSITDDKLNLLQQINTMEEHLIHSSSLFAYYIFKYIKTIVMLRQESQYGEKVFFSTIQNYFLNWINEKRYSQIIRINQKVIKNSWMNMINSNIYKNIGLKLIFQISISDFNYQIKFKK